MAPRIQEGIKPRIDVGFRPGLILFVDQAGEQICQQLKQIMQKTCFDEILHQCIALVQITIKQESATGKEDMHDSVDEGDASNRIVNDQFSGGETFDNDSDEEIDRSLQQEMAIPIPVGEQFPEGDFDMPVEPDYLDTLIAHSLKSIQLERRLIEIGEMGYPVPNTRPQIYIVGSVRSKKLRAIHAMVQKLLRQRGFATLVCYVLDAYEISNATAVSQADDPLGPKDNTYWQQHEVPNFCYIYEDQINHPTVRTVTEAESHYAAAETLFALLATGITPDMHFEQMMELQPNLTRYTNVGSMGTSLIIFPREVAQEFCSARLGFTLLQQWQSDIDLELLSEPKRRQLQERARKEVEQVEQWIKDVKPRPNANGDANDAKVSKPRDNDEGERQENTWPSLDILKRDNHPVSTRALTQQSWLHRDLRERSRTLFKLFHSEDVAEEVRKLRKHRETWTNVVDKRVGRARDASNTWEQTAVQAWDIAGNLANATVKQAVDVLWASRENGTFGFEMARTYTDTYDERLSKLQDYLGRLRDIHQRDYEESMNGFELQSTGPWLVQPNDSNIIHNGDDARATTQVGPKARGAVFESTQLDNAGGINGASMTEDVAASPDSSQFPSEREERIGNQLAQRILWLQDQVPSIPTQITISLPFVLALVLSGLALYPQGTLLYTLLLAVGVSAVVCAMNWTFWKRYQLRVEDAHKDLLRFYRRIFAYRCEQLEDELRNDLISPLRRKILAMRERLENISAFIGAVQFQFDQQYRQVRRDLFSNPSGVRDIYIANGERLQNQGRNTIEDFATQVTRMRESRPVVDWHRSLLEMREQLIESFRALPQSIIEMDVDQARDHIHAFTSDITDAYLQGPLVDVRRALDKNEVWKEALHRARSPLYRAEVGIREPQMLFVCGQHANLNKGELHWPSNATPVLLSDHYDWVLVLALFRGGLPPALDPEIHFPQRHALTNGSGGPENNDDFSSFAVPDPENTRGDQSGAYDSLGNPATPPEWMANVLDGANSHPVSPQGQSNEQGKADDVPPIRSGQFHFGQSPNRLGNFVQPDKQETRRMRPFKLRPLSESDLDNPAGSGGEQ